MSYRCQKNIAQGCYAQLSRFFATMNKEALIFLLVTLFVATQGQQICRALALGGGGTKKMYFYRLLNR